MPTITSKSRVRAVSDHCSLSLNVRHRLLAGDASDTVHIVKKTRPPDGLDVLIASSLVLTLSGTLDGAEVASEVIERSQLARHLLEYLRMNCSELGLASVSNIHMNDSKGPPCILLTSSRCLAQSQNVPTPHLTLAGLDLQYAWQTVPRGGLHSDSPLFSQPAIHSFSQQSSLPFLTLLDNVVGRFATWHLVKRYPLIFGPWCQQLDIETPFFPAIYRSIINILRRSPDPSFRMKCRDLLKMIKRRVKTNSSDTTAWVAEYVKSTGDENILGNEHMRTLTDEDAFVIAMKLMYRSSMRQPRFKGLTRIPSGNGDDDDNELSQDHSSAREIEVHEVNFLWNNLSSHNQRIQHDLSFLALDSFFSPSSPSALLPCSDNTDMELTILDQDTWSDNSDMEAFSPEMNPTNIFDEHENRPGPCELANNFKSSSPDISRLFNLGDNPLFDDIACTRKTQNEEHLHTDDTLFLKRRYSYLKTIELQNTDLEGTADSDSDYFQDNDMPGHIDEHDQSADSGGSQAKGRDERMAIELGSVVDPVVVPLSNVGEEEAALCLPRCYTLLQDQDEDQFRNVPSQHEQQILAPLQYAHNSETSIIFFDAVDDDSDLDMLSGSRSEYGTECGPSSDNIEEHALVDFEDEDRTLTVPDLLVMPRPSDSQDAYAHYSGYAFKEVELHEDDLPDKVYSQVHGKMKDDGKTTVVGSMSSLVTDAIEGCGTNLARGNWEEDDVFVVEDF